MGQRSMTYHTVYHASGLPMPMRTARPTPYQRATHECFESPQKCLPGPLAQARPASPDKGKSCAWLSRVLMLKVDINRCPFISRKRHGRNATLKSDPNIMAANSPLADGNVATEAGRGLVRAGAGSPRRQRREVRDGADTSGELSGGALARPTMQRGGALSDSGPGHTWIGSMRKPAPEIQPGVDWLTPPPA